jgi:hypothetical protein
MNSGSCHKVIEAKVKEGKGTRMRNQRAIPSYTKTHNATHRQSCLKMTVTMKGILGTLTKSGRPLFTLISGKDDIYLLKYEKHMLRKMRGYMWEPVIIHGLLDIKGETIFIKEIALQRSSGSDWDNDPDESKDLNQILERLQRGESLSTDVA